MTASPEHPAPDAFSTNDMQHQILNFWHTCVAWLGVHWLQVLIALAVGALIFVGLHFVKSLGKKLCARDETGTGWFTVFGSAIAKTGNFFIIMTAAELVAGIGQAPTQIAQIIKFLFTVAAVFQAAIWAREIIIGAIEHRTGGPDHQSEALANAMGLIRLAVTFVLFAIALVMILSNLGVNVTGLIAGLGVGGIAIGLAAQSIFADLFAAISIIFDRPFRAGDAITYDKSSGTVESVGMRSTRIRGTTGESRVIGNKKLLDFEIVNNTQREFRRVIFTLGIVQTTPIDVMDKLPHLLKDIVEDHKGKFIRAGFVAFGPQSYDFELHFDSVSAKLQDMFDLRHSIGLAIIQRFNEDGIVLAYPTQIGLTAEEGGMIPPARRKAAKIKDSNATIDPPPSSGDQSAADQEGGV